jgi:hypothetical protein
VSPTVPIPGFHVGLISYLIVSALYRQQLQIVVFLVVLITVEFVTGAFWAIRGVPQIEMTGACIVTRPVSETFYLLCVSPTCSRVLVSHFFFCKNRARHSPMHSLGFDDSTHWFQDSAHRLARASG